MSSVALSSARAAWPVYGAAATTAGGLQDEVVMVRDGSGGTVVAWVDRRTDSSGDIYAQRFDATGVALWTAGGEVLCTAAGAQLRPVAAPDGTGGAIVAWQDNRTDANGDIYAQRVGGAGSVQWAADGVALVTGLSQDVETVQGFHMIADGSGGAVLVFQDDRNADGTIDPSFSKVWAQRVSGAGVALWGNGAPVGAGVYAHSNGVLVSDGMGGAIFAWQDGSVFGDWNISAQHLSASGSALWGSGVSVCAASGQQYLPGITTDEAGGAIVAWEDTRVDANGDIYAQRIDATGAALWATDGVAIVSGPSSNNSGDYIVQLAPDGAGGAIVALADNRNAGGTIDPSFSKVWAQRVSATGSALWGNGVPVGAGPGAHGNHRIVSDAAGGAIVVWQDGSSFGNWNISAQRLDPAGTALWSATGVSLCAASGQQTYPDACPDGAGGVIAAWTDSRSDAGDVYAQRSCTPNGVTVGVDGSPLARIGGALGTPCPNPSTGGISYSISLARAAHVRVAVYDVGGRLVRVLRDQTLPSGRGEYSWAPSDGRAIGASGVYFLVLDADGTRESRKFVISR